MKFRSVLMILVVGFSSIHVFSQNNNESSEVANKQNTNDVFKQLYEEAVIEKNNKEIQIKALNDIVAEKDSRIEALTNELKAKSLDQSSALQELKDDYENRIKETHDFYQRKLLSNASFFLFVPYNEDGVNKIAIPTFELVDNTSTLYLDYKYRLDFLRDFKNDLTELINFLDETEQNLNKITATSPNMLDKIFKSKVDTLNKLPVIVKYKKYPNMANSFILQQYNLINSALNGSSLDSTKKKISAIKNNLQSLLPTNS